MNDEEVKEFTEEVERSVIRNYWSNYGTFDGIENVPGMVQQVKDIHNYYPYIGFKNKEELDTLTEQVTEDELTKTIGITVTSKVTKLIGEFLKPSKIAYFPGSNKYVGDIIRDVSQADLKTKIILLGHLSNAGITQLLPQLYPEKEINPNITYEGIYMGKIYMKEDFEFPTADEVIAYMLGIVFKPSEMFSEITIKVLTNPIQLELLPLTEEIGIYREVVLFANKFGLKVADIWETLDAQYYDHSKTLKDSILLMYKTDEEVLITFTYNSFQVTMKEHQFYRLYNEDQLENITVREADSHYEEGSTVFELILDDTKEPVWKYLQLKHQPFSANNLAQI